MPLPANKTKIVCTIGPACEDQDTVEKMILAGMNVARLNFSHGDFSGHKSVIQCIRAAAQVVGRRVAIMADLPGPKMRIGRLAEEPIELRAGDQYTLTTQDCLGDRNRVWVSFSRLPQAVKAGDVLFLNDGLIQLDVQRVDGPDVHCAVAVGGELRSRKGLNLPGIELGISAFTDLDLRCMKFALEQGVDAVSQSFVENRQDIEAVRQAASKMGFSPFIIAKIERSSALNYLDDILDAADGIMVARGDLGVEVPIEKIAIIQKKVIRKANLLGKPVITATQMLESMVNFRRPTRAEATDVANAILDGSDCIMLSAESAMGKFPVDAVGMLAKIAAAVEPDLRDYQARGALHAFDAAISNVRDLIPTSVVGAVEKITPVAIFVPTRSGATARNITRYRLPTWITAVSSLDATCQRLLFSYGIHPMHEPDHPEDWNTYARNWVQSHNLVGDLVILTEGPSSKHPDANERMEIIDLRRVCGATPQGHSPANAHRASA